MVKVGNEVSSWFCIKSRVKQGCVLYPFIWIILMYFVLRRTGKTMGDHGIKWGWKTLLYLDYADDLSILHESVSKMNKLLEVLKVQGARIGLKIDVQQTKSLRLGISEYKKMTLGSEKIGQVGIFIYLGNIKQLVATNSRKKWQQTGILIPIVTSKESHLNADFEYISFIKFSLTHRRLWAWENLPYFRK